MSSLITSSHPAVAQDESGAGEAAQEQSDSGVSTDPESAPESAPGKVKVEQVVDDVDIETRLVRILEATEWYDSSGLTVDEGSHS